MDSTLTWLLLIAAVVLIVVGAVRFDVLAARWRDMFREPPPPHDAPPSPRWNPAPGFKPHEGPAHRPTFHRSGGRRH